MSLDNPYDKATKKISADIFGDLDAASSYAHKPSVSAGVPVVKPPSSHIPPPTSFSSTLSRTSSSSSDGGSSTGTAAAAAATAAPTLSPVVVDDETVAPDSLPAGRGVESLLEQVMAEAMDAKLRAFRQLAAESGVDLAEQEEHERARLAAAAAAAAAADPRRRFAFDDDDAVGADDDLNDAQPHHHAHQQHLPPPHHHHDDEYEREQAIAASIMAAQPEPPVVVAAAPPTPAAVPVPVAAPAPAAASHNPFAGGAATAPKLTPSNPFAAGTMSTQYTAGAASQSAKAAAGSRGKASDGVEIVQLAKQHGFVASVVDMPGLPWLVRIGEPEVRNPLNPATKFVVYPVMTKAFGWKCERRFSDFIWLREQLVRVHPGALVPPLPDKKFFGRFSENFVEKRREALERFLNKCTVHRQLRGADVLRFFLEKRDAKQFEQEKADYGVILPRLDPAVFERNRPIDQNVMAMLAPIINYLNVMQEYLTGLATLTSSLEQRRREEAEELRRMGATFGALFACAESGGYCWREGCRECDVVGAQMQSLGLRSARVSQVVDDCGANIYNAVWRSVRDECDTVASLREIVHQRVMIEAEYKMAVETLKETRALRANVLAKGALPKGPKDSPAAKLAQQVLVEEAAAAALKFKLDYVTMVLLDELDAFHERKAATFGVLLNHYATQSAFAAEQLHQAWADVLRAAQHIAANTKK